MDSPYKNPVAAGVAAALLLAATVILLILLCNFLAGVFLPDLISISNK